MLHRRKKIKSKWLRGASYLEYMILTSLFVVILMVTVQKFGKEVVADRLQENAVAMFGS